MTRRGATLAILAFAQIALAAPTRITFVVPLAENPSWRDMAYLAAIPASQQANPQSPSLFSIEPGKPFTREHLDYLKRFKPESLIQIGDKVTPITGYKSNSISSTGAEAASLTLSQQFWTTSKHAVLCQSDDYDSALIAASVASLLKAPLLYSESAELNVKLKTELKRLKTSNLITIGKSKPQFAGTSVLLNGPIETIKWATKNNFKISYLAAVNPVDRTKFTTRKLSLIGAQLAAGRKGLVVPLKFHVEWKKPFATTIHSEKLPPNLPKSSAPPKSGTIEVGKLKAPFILTGDKDEHNLKLSVDKTNSGQFSPPLVSGDQITFDQKRWAVSLGTRTRFGDTDVHLTWPTAEHLNTQLAKYYSALGTPPEHLCIVGFPDTIPHAIIGRGGIVEEQASDLPYAIPPGSEFAQIGVGRIIAESVQFGTLYAARALTYNQLLSPSWKNQASQAEWENSLGPLFENVGFANPHHLDAKDVPWQTPPAEGVDPVRAPSFAQNSPLARSAVLTHSEHSWWRGMGTMFTWDAEVLLAPTVVESGGCGVACLDREPDNRSVVARLLRLGAIAFSGGSRELSAETQPLRMEFWNGVLSGQTIGQAHRRALNAGLMIIKDRNEGPGGAYRYSTNVRMQFGDPAIRLNLPSSPKTAPAKTTIQGDRITVHSPEKWTVVRTFVPPDWKQWGDKPLFSVRAPGSYAMSSWSGDGRDKEIPLVTAEFVTKKRVASVTQTAQLPDYLGWNGKWYSSSNPDGTFTTRFTVRMIDFDQEKGKINKVIEKIEYQLAFE